MYGLLQLSDKSAGRDFDASDEEHVREVAALIGETLDALRGGVHRALAGTSDSRWRLGGCDCSAPARPSPEQTTGRSGRNDHGEVLVFVDAARRHSHALPSCGPVARPDRADALRADCARRARSARVGNRVRATDACPIRRSTLAPPKWYGASAGHAVSGSSACRTSSVDAGGRVALCKSAVRLRKVDVSIVKTEHGAENSDSRPRLTTSPDLDAIERAGRILDAFESSWCPTPGKLRELQATAAHDFAATSATGAPSAASPP
jgi:hypothetical protein